MQISLYKKVKDLAKAMFLDPEFSQNLSDEKLEEKIGVFVPWVFHNANLYFQEASRIFLEENQAGRNIEFSDFLKEYFKIDSGLALDFFVANSVLDCDIEDLYEVCSVEGVISFREVCDFILAVAVFESVRYQDIFDCLLPDVSIDFAEKFYGMVSQRMTLSQGREFSLCDMGYEEKLVVAKNRRDQQNQGEPQPNPVNPELNGGQNEPDHQPERQI